MTWLTAGTVGTSRRATGGGGYSGAPCGPLQHKQGRVPGAGGRRRGRAVPQGRAGAGLCRRSMLEAQRGRGTRVLEAQRGRGSHLTQRLGSRPGMRAARRGPEGGRDTAGAGAVRWAGLERLRGVRIVRRDGRRR